MEFGVIKLKHLVEENRADLLKRDAQWAIRYLIENFKNPVEVTEEEVMENDSITSFRNTVKRLLNYKHSTGIIMFIVYINKHEYEEDFHKWIESKKQI
mgnify:FL=1